ncbi:lipocalin family protein [Herbaspirillum sp. alder98]|uniref:lipocalin family protein n=1 Tax=Herbaspirillum sp. alder98 TaxID=2913096 RepID=UPI001CD873E2|nr:lipocalin family protein [Herbaspirillum sp. alder98]MCA1327060.1 lipocalin family protein [Herbaspirillum sp. alder98]
MKPFLAHPILRLAAIALASATVFATSSRPAQAQEVKTVAAVDLQRYVGKWYEIAKFPNRFQKDCIADTSAEYRARTDGNIDVINRCKTNAGTDEAQGEARVIAGSNNSKLQVRFAPSWLSWLPMVWGDYWILELDPQYTLVTVGTPSRDYLWILSRTPTVSEEQYENAVDNATKQGFDTSRLVKTRQQAR